MVEHGLPVQISSQYIFWLPEKVLFTKQGSISKRSLDLDNHIGGTIKSLQDVIFTQMEKYNANINDAFVMDMEIKKRASKNNSTGVTVHMALEEI